MSMNSDWSNPRTLSNERWDTRWERITDRLNDLTLKSPRLGHSKVPVWVNPILACNVKFHILSDFTKKNPLKIIETIKI